MRAKVLCRREHTLSGRARMYSFGALRNTLIFSHLVRHTFGGGLGAFLRRGIAPRHVAGRLKRVPLSTTLCLPKVSAESDDCSVTH